MLAKYKTKICVTLLYFILCTKNTLNFLKEQFILINSTFRVIYRSAKYPSKPLIIMCIKWAIKISKSTKPDHNKDLYSIRLFNFIQYVGISVFLQKIFLPWKTLTQFSQSRCWYPHVILYLVDKNILNCIDKCGCKSITFSTFQRLILQLIYLQE